MAVETVAVAHRAEDAWCARPGSSQGYPLTPTFLASPGPVSFEVRQQAMSLRQRKSTSELRVFIDREAVHVRDFQVAQKKEAVQRLEAADSRQYAAHDQRLEITQLAEWFQGVDVMHLARRIVGRRGRKVESPELCERVQSMKRMNTRKRVDSQRRELREAVETIEGQRIVDFQMAERREALKWQQTTAEFVYPDCFSVGTRCS